MKAKITPIEIEKFKTMTLREIFPTEPCSRCGGSGKYSFNLVDLDRCYGCNGTGWKYTRTGTKMVKAFKEAQMKPAADIKVGDIIDVDNGRGKFQKVIEIKPAEWKSGRTVNGEHIWETVHGFTFVTERMSLTTAAKLRVARSLEENYKIYLDIVGKGK